MKTIHFNGKNFCIEFLSLVVCLTLYVPMSCMPDMTPTSLAAAVVHRTGKIFKNVLRVNKELLIFLKSGSKKNLSWE